MFERLGPRGLQGATALYLSMKLEFLATLALNLASVCSASWLYWSPGYKQDTVNVDNYWQECETLNHVAACFAVYMTHILPSCKRRLKPVDILAQEGLAVQESINLLEKVSIDLIRYVNAAYRAAESPEEATRLSGTLFPHLLRQLHAFYRFFMTKWVQAQGHADKEKDMARFNDIKELLKAVVDKLPIKMTMEYQCSPNFDHETCESPSDFQQIDAESGVVVPESLHADAEGVVEESVEAGNPHATASEHTDNSVLHSFEIPQHDEYEKGRDIIEPGGCEDDPVIIAQDKGEKDRDIGGLEELSTVNLEDTGPKHDLTAVPHSGLPVVPNQDLMTATSQSSSRTSVVSRASKFRVPKAPQDMASQRTRNGHSQESGFKIPHTTKAAEKRMREGQERRKRNVSHRK